MGGLVVRQRLGSFVMGCQVRDEVLSRRTCMLLGAAAAVSARPRSGWGEQDNPVLKLYSDGGPASPYGIGARALSEDIARRTDNRLRVELVLGITAAGQALGPLRAQ